MQPVKVYKCKCCKKVYPTFMFNDNTQLLPICDCGEDLLLTTQSCRPDQCDARSEGMMLGH